ncbi:hypothetical protein [Nocardia xishanensis]|uniref:hypothetical protein n=1 Tax=Nocardia xishanensis TaxID=238964 RepID=UPI000835AF7A|nr:hypothetical protein [Nocardia xishanensis]
MATTADNRTNTRFRALLTAGLAIAAITLGTTAAPASARPAFTIKGARDRTITARATGLDHPSVCTLKDISTGRSVSEPVRADGTVELVLTQVRRGPHAVTLRCARHDGSTLVLADHWAAPVAG